MKTSRVLRTVREQRGLNLEAVASFASISPKRLSDFEVGQKEPSRKQVQRLAEIYGIPLYSLASSDLPNLPPLPHDFRKQNPAPAELSPKGMKVLWNSEKISHFTRQLSNHLKIQPPNLLGENRTVNREAAEQLRDVFENWLESRAHALRLGGSREQQFLGAFRLFLEVQGVVVNANDAPAEDYLGFYLQPDASAPVIFVNRSIQSKKAQLFTLAHEAAHWILGADGISNPFLLRNKVERSCNIFAAEFLAPMSRFRAIVEEQPLSIRRKAPEFISAVASLCLLSNHATAIRLVEGGYLSQQQLQAWESRQAEAPREEKDAERGNETSVMGQPHAKRMAEIGIFSVYLAAIAVERGQIDSYDVASGIGLSSGLQPKAFSLAKRRIEIARPK